MKPAKTAQPAQPAKPAKPRKPKKLSTAAIRKKLKTAIEAQDNSELTEIYDEAYEYFEEYGDFQVFEYECMSRCYHAHGDEALRFFAEQGLSVNARDESGEGASLLMEACSTDRDDRARLLIELGADLELKDEEGRTAAALAARSGSLACLELLAEHGANFKVQTPEGKGLLHQAASVKGVDGEDGFDLDSVQGAVRWLYGKGLDVNLKDESGETPLCDALAYGNAERALMLLDCGANPKTLNNHDRTSIITAAIYGTHVVIPRLVSMGVDIDHLDTNGHTAVYHACIEGNPHALQVLIEQGAGTHLSELDLLKIEQDGPNVPNPCLAILAAHKVRLAAQSAIEEHVLGAKHKARPKA